MEGDECQRIVVGASPELYRDTYHYYQFSDSRAAYSGPCGPIRVYDGWVQLHLAPPLCRPYPQWVTR